MCLPGIPPGLGHTLNRRKPSLFRWFPPHGLPGFSCPDSQGTPKNTGYLPGCFSLLPTWEPGLSILLLSSPHLPICRCQGQKFFARKLASDFRPFDSIIYIDYKGSCRIFNRILSQKTTENLTGGLNRRLYGKLGQDNRTEHNPAAYQLPRA